MSALDFGGGSGTNTTPRYYSVASGPSSADTTFTFCGWIRNAATAAYIYECLISYGSDPTSAEGAGLYTYTDTDGTNEVLTATCYGRLQGSSSTYWLQTRNSVGAPLRGDGKDYFVAWTADGVNHNIYLCEEGASITQNSDAGSAGVLISGSSGITASQTWHIGKEAWASPGSPMRKPLGELYYFTDLISESNLTALAAGVSPESLGLTPVCRWKFRDGEVSTESNVGSGGSSYDASIVSSGFTTTTEFWAETVPQTAAPTSDISAGSWTQSTGSTLYECIDETTPSDADYISSSTNSDTAKVKFASVTDPVSSSGHLLRYRVRATATDQITAYVYQGTTLIATDTTRAPGPTETTYTLTLSGAEADSITDYSDIRAWFTTGTHGGATSTAAQFPTVASDASETPYDGYTWSNISNITADDTSYATITHPSFDNNVYSYVAYAKGFDFSAIPDGSTITGVECIASTWYDAGSANGVLAQLLSDTGVRGGTNMWATPVTLTNTVGDTKTIGGSGQTWGNSLTAAWVKDADFGVAIALRATTNNTDVSIDYVTLKIYYTPPAADWRVTWTQWEVPGAAGAYMAQIAWVVA